MSGDGLASKIKTMLAREVFNDVHEFHCGTAAWTPWLPAGTPPISRRLHRFDVASIERPIYSPYLRPI